LEIGGVQVSQLFPGEKFSFSTAQRPSTNFAPFESAMLRNVSQALGTSTQQITGDWSDVNYSSARAAILEAWKTLHRRRNDFASGFSAPIYSCFVEESMEVDDLPMPTAGVIPAFMDCRAAYAEARWMGPGRGNIDPVKERQGAVLGMDAGLTTLENECAEASGEYWEDVLDDRKNEIQGFIDRGLTPPTWAAMNIPAEKTVTPAEPQ
jgi:lambda family phage portal protein